MSSLSLEWVFSMDNAGFVANQNVNITREKLDQDFYLICKSNQKKSTPGIKLTDVILPNDGYEYCMEVNGFANNKKSFLWVVDQKNVRLFKNYVYLPELVAQEHKIEPVKLFFKQNNINKEAQYTNITIGVLISDVLLNDMFFIKSIKLYQVNIDNILLQPNPQLVRITKVYNSTDTFKLNEINPMRDNNTPMLPGEYALINSEHEGSDHGNLYMAYTDKDNDKKKDIIRLRYISNVKESTTNLINRLKIPANQSIPIYNDINNAKKDLLEYGSHGFYDKSKQTSKIGQVSNDNYPYMYFDSDGYVRWITL
jgi:hypothetical protein